MNVSHVRDARRHQGIALAIILVMIFLMITAAYTFARRAVINSTITQNRVAASEADALARGGLRIAEAIVFYYSLVDRQGNVPPGGDPSGNPINAPADAPPQMASKAAIWAQLSGLPIQLDEGRVLRLEIEDAGARLNLNALIPPPADPGGDASSSGGSTNTTTPSSEDAEEYLVEVLRKIIDQMEAPDDARTYDERALAENLLDYIDADDVARSGRGEDSDYLAQDPPYKPRNGPLLSVDEIGLVEGFDGYLVNAMRDYVTVHPIGGVDGINLNTAEPWVLSLVYAGPSGDRELVGEDVVRDLLKLREKDQVVCEPASADPDRCVGLSEVGLGEGSIYPPSPLPARATVFRVVAQAQVGAITREMEAIIDTRDLTGPQVLSWRRLRGNR